MSTLSDSLVVPENIFEKSQQILKDASSCVLGLRWTVQPQLWRACPTPFMLSLMLEVSGEPLLALPSLLLSRCFTALKFDNDSLLCF